MQGVWDGFVFVVLITVPFGILWRLSRRLRDPRIGAGFWDLIFRGSSFIRSFRLFSTETADTHQEAEYTDEHPVDITRALPWLARAVLLALYLSALLIWIN